MQEKAKTVNTIRVEDGSIAVGVDLCHTCRCAALATPQGDAVPFCTRCLAEIESSWKAAHS